MATKTTTAKPSHDNALCHIGIEFDATSLAARGIEIRPRGDNSFVVLIPSDNIELGDVEVALRRAGFTPTETERVIDYAVSERKWRILRDAME